MKKPLITKSVSLKNAKYAYVSACCQALADKPSLVKTEEALGTLGSWRCSNCRKSCKVRPVDKTPYLPKKVEPVQGAVAI